MRGDYEAAHALYEEALAILDDLDDRWWMAWCLEGLAGRLRPKGNPCGRRSCSEQPRSCARRSRHPPRGTPGRLRTQGCRRAQLDEAAFATAWAEGQEMTPEQALVG